MLFSMEPTCSKNFGESGGTGAGAVIDYHPIQEGRENVASKNELPV